MATQNVKPVYFFHIPKTSGRFFTINTTVLLEHELLNRGIQYKNILKAYGHRSFEPVDSVDMLGYTFLRDPVARTISHWLHIYENQLTGSMVADKRKLFDFLHANPTDPIIDYQTKFIIFNGGESPVDIFRPSFVERISSSDFALAQSRLSKLTYIFDQKDQGDNLRYKFLDILYAHYGITPTVPNTVNIRYRIGNNESLRMHSSLSDSEILEMQDLLRNDMNLYDSAAFSKL